MLETEREKNIFLAGIFEGGGSVYFRNRGRGLPMLTIQFTNDVCVIEWMAETLGGGTFSRPEKIRPGALRFNLTTPADQRTFFERVQPYATGRRALVEACLDFLNQRVKVDDLARWEREAEFAAKPGLGNKLWVATRALYDLSDTIDGIRDGVISVECDNGDY